MTPSILSAGACQGVRSIMRRASACPASQRDVSAVFGVPHVLFQQHAASSICNCSTAASIRCYEPERAKLVSNVLWKRRRIPFRFGSCPDPAQPVEIVRRKVLIRSCHALPTYPDSGLAGMSAQSPGTGVVSGLQRARAVARDVKRRAFPRNHPPRRGARRHRHTSTACRLVRRE